MTKFKKLAVVGLTAAMTMAMSIAAFASTTITVHFKNAAKWDNVGVWAFEGVGFTTQVMPADKCPIYNTTTKKAIWPGARMEAEADYAGWYKMQFTYEDTSKGAVFIFNNLVADTHADTTTGGDPTDEEFLQAAKAKGLICDTSLKKQAANKLIHAKDFDVKEYWCDFNGIIPGSSELLLKAKPASYVKKVSTKVDNLATAGASSKSIKLTWNKYSGATSYKVMYYNATTKKYVVARTVKTNTYTITKTGKTAIKTGKTYKFMVAAYKGSKQVAKSAAVNGMAINVPTMTKVAKGTKRVNVTFKKVSGVTSYVVYRATSAKGKYTPVGTTTKTTYADKTVVSGKTYYYKVGAVKKVGKVTFTGAMSTKYLSIKFK